MTTLNEVYDEGQFNDCIHSLSNLWMAMLNKVASLKQELCRANAIIDDSVNDRAITECNNSYLQAQVNDQLTIIECLNSKIKQMEEEQKQFSRVSHIVAMEKENTKLRQDSALLQQRLQFYQNQVKLNNVKNHTEPTCYGYRTYHGSNVKPTFSSEVLFDLSNNDLNDLNDLNELSELSELNDLIMSENDNGKSDINQELQVHEDSNDVDIQVSQIRVAEGKDEKDEDEGVTNSFVEKKIKGVVYYVVDDTNLHQKNEDDTVGPIIGRLDKSPDGKVKVKWIKL